MAEYIEGRRAVEEALRAGVPIRKAYVQAAPVGPAVRKKGRGEKAVSAAGADQNLERLVCRLREEGVAVEATTREFLDRISAEGRSHGAHQGVVCEVPPFSYADLDDIAREGGGKPESLVLVLDHITDEGNLGAIIRTAEVVGADGVVIASKRAAQVTVGVYKTSAGAAFHVPIARVPNLVSALETLKRVGFWVAGASEHAAENIWHAPLGGRVALVCGNEGAGISRLVQESCDFLVALPQRGQVGSLNVAQATTAICYEWLRRSFAGREG